MNSGKMMMQIVILAVVVVGLVFTITFVMMSQSEFGLSGTTKPPTPGPGFSIDFPETRPPAPITHEWKTPGNLDFWFENKTEKPVQLGMRKKSCTCTGAQIALLSRERTALHRLGGFVLGHSALPTSSPFLLAAALRELDVPSTEHNVDWQELKKDEASAVTVPGRSGGWVRLGWNGDTATPGPQRFNATFWMEDETAGSTVALEAPVFLVEPLMAVEKTWNAGVLTPGSVAKTEIRCWSATRSSFQLLPSAESDSFITFGAQIPLSADEIKESASKHFGMLRVAYRIPISIQERLSDGRQMDLGPFVRKVTIRTIPEVQPVEIEITGLVRGEFTVGVAPSKDQIPLGTFRIGEERVVDVPIFTDRADMELQIDSAPDFLKAVLSTVAPEGSGKRWNLRVTVGADLKAGQLESGTAVYLKTQTQRRIRIPVTGTASQ